MQINVIALAGLREQCYIHLWNKSHDSVMLNQILLWVQVQAAIEHQPAQFGNGRCCPITLIAPGSQAGS